MSTRPPLPPGTTRRHETASTIIGVVIVLAVWVTVVSGTGITGRSIVALLIALGIIGFVAATGMNRCNTRRRR